MFARQFRAAGKPFSSGRTPRENTKPLKRSQLIENVITPRKFG
jgi:hypothetical protein